jgi:thymidylate synthase
MNFGHTHIYKEHIDGAVEYLDSPVHKGPTLKLDISPIATFGQHSFTIENYVSESQIKFILKE